MCSGSPVTVAYKTTGEARHLEVENAHAERAILVMTLLSTVTVTLIGKMDHEKIMVSYNSNLSTTYLKQAPNILAPKTFRRDG